MRRIINSTYLSLDGVVQLPEQWTFDFRDEAADRFAHDQLNSSGAILMGRQTYDIFAAVWPEAREATGMADRMNALPKYVVSDTLTEPGWNNTTVINRAAFPARMRELKQESGQDILQFGYGQVTATLLREGLLDELRIWLHPILVGRSDPAALLAHVGAAAKFRLVDVKTYDSGLVILNYQPTQPA